MTALPLIAFGVTAMLRTFHKNSKDATLRRRALTQCPLHSQHQQRAARANGVLSHLTNINITTHLAILFCHIQVDFVTIKAT